MTILTNGWMRLGVALAAGVVSALAAAAAGAAGVTVVMLGWCGFALVFVAILGLTLGRYDGPTTMQHAIADEPGKAVREVLVLGTSIASLGGVALLLLSATSSAGDPVLAALVGVCAVVSAWLLLHGVFTLRYAALYYAHEGTPIDFHDSEVPRYLDFAYFSYNLGMTYQVSDTDVGSSRIRATVLGHCLLSYAFGTAVLGSTINLVLQLAGG